MNSLFNLVNLISDNILPFGMVVTRLSIIIFSIPPFNSRTIPNNVKVLLSLSFALLIFPMVGIKLDIMNLNYFEIFSYLASEVIFGLVIGFIVSAVFAAIQAAGRIIDINNGFGFSQIVDPVSNISTTPTSNFFSVVAATLFVTIGGHNLLIGAIVKSYIAAPMGKVVFQSGILEILIGTFGNILVVGLKIAAPIMATLILTEIVLAVMARIIPQIPVFIVGFPLKILVSLVAVAYTMVNTIPYLQGLFENSFMDIDNLLRLL